MKRLLAAGSGDIYQLGRAFRDGEAGPRHNPEFTLLEWYRLGFDHHRLMDEVEALLGALLGARLTLPAERLTLPREFRPRARARPARRRRKRSCARSPAPGSARTSRRSAPGRDDVLDLLMGALVGPALGRDRITFVHDYPAAQAALARLLPGEPRCAARFEAYVGGLELCNGFHELADAGEQRRRFEADLAARAARGLPAVAIDERLLAALAAGLPDVAGVAVGFDRVRDAGGRADRHPRRCSASRWTRPDAAPAFLGPRPGAAGGGDESCRTAGAGRGERRGALRVAARRARRPDRRRAQPDRQPRQRRRAAVFGAAGAQLGGAFTCTTAPSSWSDPSRASPPACASRSAAACAARPPPPPVR